MPEYVMFELQGIVSCILPTLIYFFSQLAVSHGKQLPKEET